MPIPIIGWVALALAGGGTAAVVANETGEAADSLTDLTKWAVVAGGLYVSYRALQSGGVLK